MEGYLVLECVLAGAIGELIPDYFRLLQDCLVLCLLGLDT